MEKSPLICSANQWTGFCMIGTSVMKELLDYKCIRFIDSCLSNLDGNAVEKVYLSYTQTFLLVMCCRLVVQLQGGNHQKIDKCSRIFLSAVLSEMDGFQVLRVIGRNL